MKRCEWHPVVRVLDESAGLVEYTASDETLDSYREVVRANGARFDLFRRNAPFVDSHQYDSIERVLGTVVDFEVRGKSVVETVKWAVDVPENKLAQLGFRMTTAGHLKAVSIGFLPEAIIGPQDTKAYADQLKELGLAPDKGPRRIYTAWQQVELSACVLGANPNALARSLEVVARSYKAGVLDDADLEFLSQEYAHTAGGADWPADVPPAWQRASGERFLESFERTINAALSRM